MVRSEERHGMTVAVSVVAGRSGWSRWSVIAGTVVTGSVSWSVPWFGTITMVGTIVVLAMSEVGAVIACSGAVSRTIHVRAINIRTVTTGAVAAGLLRTGGATGICRTIMFVALRTIVVALGTVVATMVSRGTRLVAGIAGRGRLALA